MTILKGYHSRWDTLKNPHCSMAMSAKHRSKFAALQRLWGHLHMSEKFSSGTKKTKQTKNQTLSYILKNIIGNLEGLISHVLNTCMDGLQKNPKTFIVHPSVQVS